MSTRPWAFQQGVLWAMELTRAPLAPLPAAGGTASPPPQRPSGVGAAASSTGENEPPLPRAAESSQDLRPATFAEAGIESIAELARAMGLRDRTEVARRLAHGRRCFVGRRDGAIVTYAWLSVQYEDVGELERAYRLPPGEAYIWDCATLPAYRGAGLYGALLRDVVARLSAEGQQRAWIGANLENEPSLRAFARAGFQPIVRVAYVRLLRLRCLRLRAQPGATTELLACARTMLTEPYERAWRSLIAGVQPRSTAMDPQQGT